MNLNPDAFIQVMPYLAQGLWYTVIITFVGVAIGCIIGSMFGLMSIARFKVVRWMAITYIELIRGTLSSHRSYSFTSVFLHCLITILTRYLLGLPSSQLIQGRISLKLFVVVCSPSIKGKWKPGGPSGLMVDKRCATLFGHKL